MALVDSAKTLSPRVSYDISVVVALSMYYCGDFIARWCVIAEFMFTRSMFVGINDLLHVGEGAW